MWTLSWESNWVIISCYCPDWSTMSEVYICSRYWSLLFFAMKIPNVSGAFRSVVSHRSFYCYSTCGFFLCPFTLSFSVLLEFVTKSLVKWVCSIRSALNKVYIRICKMVWSFYKCRFIKINVFSPQWINRYPANYLNLNWIVISQKGAKLQQF